MASQMQVLIYEGHMGSDPEMRYTPGGKAVTSFSMASNSSYKSADGEVVKNTIWLRITAWNKLAEIVNQYCQKGSHVIVTGTLKAGPNGSPTVYQNRSGDMAASFEVTASSIRILDFNNQREEVSAESEEDLPF